jgi:dTDP-4-amino-4,6-dideoxygalactose transaminase
VDIGSSFLPGEVVAAFLWAQLQEADSITAQRVALWDGYLRRLAPRAAKAGLTLPTVPAHCAHNAHMFYLLLPRAGHRAGVLSRMNEAGVNAVFHYVPLHSSPAGRKYGRVCGTMRVTDDVSARLIRLPLWADLSEAEADYVCETLLQTLGGGGG